MRHPKVTVVGAGFVGATTAQRIVEKGLADCVLVDVIEGLAQGKALDMMHSAPLQGFSSKIVGAEDYEPTENSDLVIVTAGLARKPGMSRDDLLLKNAEIVSQVIGEVVARSPGTLLLMVTNPLDVMTYLAWKKSGFEPKRVVGMSGLLDSARYATVIAAELGVSVHEVRAMVLGGHGDSMVPLPRHSTWKGVPITKLFDREKIEVLHQKTRDMGAEIVNLLKTGSAFYAPSAACLTMAEAILKGSDEAYPCCAYVTGQYGIRDVFCGVPVKLGKKGVEQVVELELTSEESATLKRSADHIRSEVTKLKLN